MVRPLSDLILRAGLFVGIAVALVGTTGLVTADPFACDQECRMRTTFMVCTEEVCSCVTTKIAGCGYCKLADVSGCVVIENEPNTDGVCVEDNTQKQFIAVHTDCLANCAIFSSGEWVIEAQLTGTITEYPDPTGLGPFVCK